MPGCSNGLSTAGIYRCSVVYLSIYVYFSPNFVAVFSFPHHLSHDISWITFCHSQHVHLNVQAIYFLRIMNRAKSLCCHSCCWTLRVHPHIWSLGLNLIWDHLPLWTLEVLMWCHSRCQPVSAHLSPFNLPVFCIMLPQTINVFYKMTLHHI